MSEPKKGECPRCSQPFEEPGCRMAFSTEDGWYAVALCRDCFINVWTEWETLKEAERYQDLDGYLFARLKLNPATKYLVACLTYDRPLTQTEVKAFGIASEAHERALHAILFNGVPSDDDQHGSREKRNRIIQLEQALGKGPKLTALARRYAPEFEVTFRTSWDEMAEFEEKYAGNR